ncbi:MAG: MBL fold metallo-hydrolase [Candidatus Aminicenantes bacterium]|nr:MBL fold metallo-hydrolase [Candidatus Aminicenantes bacterium]
MKNLKNAALLSFLAAYLVISGHCLCLAQESEENIPITTQRLSDRVLVLSETVMGNNITAVASEKGIVIVDTSGLPSTAAKIRRIIEKEFGRNDFAYVINTHSHWDHSFGNQVFPEAVIIGHKNVIPGMSQDKDYIPRRITMLEQRLKENTDRLKNTQAGSEEARNIETFIETLKREIFDFKNVFVSTPPHITFNDRMILNLGDITVKLDYFGRAHSTSDIFIHIPEEKILMTGDLFLDQRWVPLFSAQLVLDIDRWLEVLHQALDGDNPPVKVIPGHMDIWETEKLALWRDYIKNLWEKLKSAKEQGLSLEQVKEKYPLPEPYYYLRDRGHSDERINTFHENNIEAFWSQLFISAADVIEKALMEGGIQGIEAAKQKLAELKKQPETYLVSERQFNALGYQFLQRNILPYAITVFRMNVETFPDSYNVYDSLAEAYLIMGDKYPSILNYKKSLELNPQNDNARDRLERMDELFEEYHPTIPEDALYAAGEQTGLEGPYLGQKPPGLKMEKFAPGIVSTKGGHEFSCTFSADGKEFYFNRGMTIMVCRWEKEGWTAPEPASFNGVFRNHEPHITADNQTLFFGSMRPNPERPDMENPYGIWKMERTGKDWGKPSYVGYGMYVTTTQDGIIYITDNDYKDWKKFGIARTKLVNGRFGPFERQKGGVASPAPGRMAGSHPCIAPDESFIIFDSYTIDPPFRQAQLFICFREEDGSWGKAANISRMLGTEGNIAASLSPDGKYLFFEAESDIYWVSTEIIDKLKK